MHRYVALYVSTVILVAGCGGATRKGSVSFSDAAVSFARSTPVPSREITSVSDCAATAECQRLCEAGQLQACTPWGDMLHGKEPARAEALWLAACQRRDASACVRMMALTAAKPRIADAYARHACAYGAADICELLGMILMLRGLGSKDGQGTALLRDAAEVFEMGCGFEHWQSCRWAVHMRVRKELAGEPSRLGRLPERAFTLATRACEATDTEACLFLGVILEALGNLENTKEHYARSCRALIETTPTLSYADAMKSRICLRASELAVAPPPESIVRTEPSEAPHMTAVVYEARRLAGPRKVMPSAPVRIAMQRLGLSRFHATLKLCLSSSGLVANLRILESSEFSSYDLELLETLRTWRYSPYMIDGKASPVCTLIEIVYTQRN